MSKGVFQLLVGILIFFILGYIFSDIYLYFTISIVMSAILRPVANYVAKIQVFKVRIPRLIAVLSSFAVFGVAIVIFVSLFVPLISDQIQVLGKLDLYSLTERLGKPFENVESFLIENKLAEIEPGFIMESFRLQMRSLFAQINFGNLLNVFLSYTGSVFIGFLAITFITFFLLYEMGPIRRFFISLIPNKYFEVTIAAYNKIERLLSNYLLGLLFQMTAIFTLASIGLSLVGVKYALTIALFAAVANIIPYLGPIIGATFGIIVGISTSPELVSTQESFVYILKIMAVFAVVQVTDNLLWQPLIFSKSVKAHPLEIFIIIFAGATIAGVLGMIAAIPVYTILRVSFMELYKGYKRYRIFQIQKVRLR
ncbi:MAG: AI-2E family transporter [Cyclobacteriaceae bacterium]|nr:AI-2E family transporter [Cyclobacteriaceae bacterium]